MRTHMATDQDGSLHMGAHIIILLTWGMPTILVVHVIPHTRILFSPNGVLLFV